MPKKPLSIEVVQEGDERFLIKTYANGEKVRESIVSGPRKKRYPDRPYRHWTFDRTKKNGFCKLALRRLDPTSPALLCSLGAGTYQHHHFEDTRANMRGLGATAQLFHARELNSDSHTETRDACLARPGWVIQ